MICPHCQKEIEISKQEASKVIRGEWSEAKQKAQEERAKKPRKKKAKPE